MSNSSILDRIERKLRDLESGEIKAIGFSEYLRASINAMDAVPYNLIEEASSLGYDAEMAAYEIDEGFAADLPSVLMKIKTLLEKLRSAG